MGLQEILWVEATADYRGRDRVKCFKLITRGMYLRFPFRRSSEASGAKERRRSVAINRELC